MTKTDKILVYGIGNKGRQDDGLGIRLVEELEAMQIPELALDSNYQLNVEDCLIFSQYDLVIFADATFEKASSFTCKKLEPAQEIEVFTHSMHPASVLGIALKLYPKVSEAFLLTIPGCEWEINEKMTPMAEKQLGDALKFMTKVVTSKNPLSLLQ